MRARVTSGLQGRELSTGGRGRTVARQEEAMRNISKEILPLAVIPVRSCAGLKTAPLNRELY